MAKVFQLSTALFRKQSYNQPDTMPDWLMTQLRTAFATQNVTGIVRLNQAFSQYQVLKQNKQKGDNQQ